MPPFGADMNGILNQITLWSQWFEAGGPINYDSTFATGASGGYPQGAIVQSSIVPGNFWLNQVDNNTANPDAGGVSNWIPLPGMAQTGTVGWTLTTVPSGWVISQPNYTIGSAASGANFASSTAQFLYQYFWNGFSNTQCPVTGGRGANAAADFAANKPIQVFNMGSSMQISNDFASGILSGVPFISGNGNTNGSIIGEVLHTLITGELSPHTHNYSGTTATESVAHFHNVSGNTATENQPHNHNYTLNTNFFGVGTGATDAWAGTQTTTTGNENQNHLHSLSINSGTESALHSHTYSGATDTGSGISGAAHNNTPRAIVGFWMFKL